MSQVIAIVIVMLVLATTSLLELLEPFQVLCACSRATCRIVHDSSWKTIHATVPSKGLLQSIVPLVLATF